MRKFTKAITKLPCRNMIYGLTESKEGAPDFDLARQQHDEYVTALEQCGLDATILPEDENYPDSTFVEDVALITPKCAIISRPGAITRRGETDAMKRIVSKFFQNVEEIESPGTVDAGDILMVGDHYYIGLSERTNEEGAKQIIDFLNKYNMIGSTVELRAMLHLKSGVAYLENNTLVATGELINKPEFEKFNRIEVPDNEKYSANCLWVNDYVLVADGYPTTKLLIEEAGYKVITLDMSEFRKLDGGLSCLSLRF